MFSHVQRNEMLFFCEAVVWVTTAMSSTNQTLVVVLLFRHPIPSLKLTLAVQNTICFHGI
jgi:hypothetical protein